MASGSSFGVGIGWSLDHGPESASNEDTTRKNVMPDSTSGRDSARIEFSGCTGLIVEDFIAPELFARLQAEIAPLITTRAPDSTTE